MKRIEQDDFNWLNETITTLLPRNSRNNVARSAIKFAKRLASESRKVDGKWTIPLMCVCYAFSRGYSQSENSKIVTTFPYGAGSVDPMEQTGLFKLNSEDHTYSIGGIPLHHERERTQDPGFLLNSLTNGFKVDAKIDPKAPWKSLAVLMKNAHNIDDGLKFTTIIAGRSVSVTRDRGIYLARELTIDRTMAPYEIEPDDPNEDIIEALFRKRRAEVSLTGGAAKKRRIAERETLGIDEEDYC